jgi:hypothetical protein
MVYLYMYVYIPWYILYMYILVHYIWTRKECNGLRYIITAGARLEILILAQILI